MVLHCSDPGNQWWSTHPNILENVLWFLCIISRINPGNLGFQYSIVDGSWSYGGNFSLCLNIYTFLISGDRVFSSTNPPVSWLIPWSCWVGDELITAPSTALHSRVYFLHSHLWLVKHLQKNLYHKKNSDIKSYIRYK